MGWLRKTIKKIGKGIKKVGKKIGKAFKKVLKPFAKIFNKLGPLGTIALSMFLPGIGTALAGWGAGMGNVLGTMIKFVGNAINYVATAPQKIFGTITDAIGASWNTLAGATTGTWLPGCWFDNFANNLQKFCGDLSAKERRDAAEEDRQNQIQDDIDQKRADEEQTRLRIEAERKLLESGGESYEIAHGTEVVSKDGETITGLSTGAPPVGGKDAKGNLIPNKSNADVVNPVYKKEYELAYTRRKVDKFQNSLNNRAEAEVKG